MVDCINLTIPVSPLYLAFKVGVWLIICGLIYFSTYVLYLEVKSKKHVDEAHGIFLVFLLLSIFITVVALGSCFQDQWLATVEYVRSALPCINVKWV